MYFINEYCQYYNKYKFTLNVSVLQSLTHMDNYICVDCVDYEIQKE